MNRAVGFGSGELLLEPLDDWTPEQWDSAIANFPGASFYHGSAWLGAVEQIGNGRMLRFRLVQHGRTAGYFPALLARKGPFRVLGSPLSGTLTEHLGPLGNDSFPLPAFLSALDRFCRARRIHYLELGSPLFDPELMRQHGYEPTEWSTIEVGLRDSADAMWTAMSGKARNRIRRAEGSGLIARSAADPGFLDRHFRLVQEVFRRHRLAPRFAKRDLQTVRDRLGPVGQVFLVEIYHSSRLEPVASGIFPHDTEVVYALSTASSEEGRVFCANDFLHWNVMRQAGALGLSRYRMGDNYRIVKESSRFKDKFGGTPVAMGRFVRHSSRLARHSARLFAAWKHLRRRLT